MDLAYFMMLLKYIDHALFMRKMGSCSCMLLLYLSDLVASLKRVSISSKCTQAQRTFQLVIGNIVGCLFAVKAFKFGQRVRQFLVEQTVFQGRLSFGMALLLGEPALQAGS